MVEHTIVLVFACLGTMASAANMFNSFYSPVSPRPQSVASTATASRNVFNDRATILYKPQTTIDINDGQAMPGRCPVTRPATGGYTSFRQYEGLWFKRYRSRVRPDEPFFKCAWIDYVDQGNNHIFISDNLQNNATNSWFRQNATTEVWPTDPTMWTSTMPSGAKFNTRLLHYDGAMGVAVIYSCSQTSATEYKAVGSIYVRSPSLVMPQSYVDFLFDIFYQNGLYNVMPLHRVDQDRCENMPRPR